MVHFVMIRKSKGLKDDADMDFEITSLKCSQTCRSYNEFYHSWKIISLNYINNALGTFLTKEGTLVISFKKNMN